MHFRILIILLLLVSCSSKKETEKEESLDLSSCKIDLNSVDNKAVLININANIDKLTPCLKNYLRLSKINNFSYSGCVRLLVSKSGQVQKVALHPSNLPNDLKMCVEQELWFFNFENLYLDEKQNISFPIQLSK